MAAGITANASRHRPDQPAAARPARLLPESVTDPDRVRHQPRSSPPSARPSAPPARSSLPPAHPSQAGLRQAQALAGRRKTPKGSPPLEGRLGVITTD